MAMYSFARLRWFAAVFALTNIGLPNLFLVSMKDLTFAEYSSIFEPIYATTSYITPTNETNALLSDSNNAEDVLKFNFFYRALNGDFNITYSIKGIQVLKQYIDEHNQETLMQEWTSCGETFNDCEPLQKRKFVVAYYSCPVEAGNRLLRFLNAYILAIMSNRTVLWDYYSTENCMMNDVPPEYFDEARCNSLDTIEACDKVLVRHPWIPSFTEWRDRLELPRQGVLMEAENTTEARRGWLNNYDHIDSPRLFRISKMINGKLFYQMTMPHVRNSRVANKILQERAGSIMEHGLYFAAGMLLESVFTIEPSLEPKEVPKLPPASLYLHSRHPAFWYNGSDIEDEKNCLNTLLQGYNKSCAIILMSDRELTIDLLKYEIESKWGCQTLVANTTKVVGETDANHTMNEHGIFRGVGYFQDWALARHARAAGIAYHKHPKPVLRTSSFLIQASIEFRRIFEYNTMKEVPFFDVCFKRAQRLKSQPLISRKFYK